MYYRVARTTALHLSEEEFIDDDSQFDQTQDRYLRHNFQFFVLGHHSFKARPNSDQEWTVHNLVPPQEFVPDEDEEELGELDENNFWGESETRKKRLTTLDEKRVSKKRKRPEYEESSIELESEVSDEDADKMDVSE